ncbi:tripartite ATP-independent transporter DctQ subunit [Litoreibacter ponti]|uniref:TRAP transporter small permease protein n=1 Tax=Litoreibacter ponti TaxID=1510457 RepID=A0A2T6BIE1_9RHOB|nr:TRAP transporter small permease [Litoreibacter ponti]PTX55827.1 tripartite ATP-independent transporter DctQ subunit [Litoreibacter ponti]
MALAPQLEARIGRSLEAVCRWLAFGGGLILVAAAAITVASIIGRALLSFGLGPIKGDFELVEAGCAIAIFAFLPWCQLKRGHVTVDIVVDRMPARAKAALGLIGDMTVAVVSGLILWRIYLGFGEKFPYFSESLRGALGMGSKPFFPETTYELEMPVWIPYGLATIGATLFFVVSLYTVWRALNWVLAGHEVRP